MATNINIFPVHGRANGCNVVDSLDQFFSIVAEADADMDIYIQAELAEKIAAYLYTDITSLWVTYGEVSRFNIYSNQQWIIHNND